MIVELVVRSVHCDHCDNSTAGWSRMDTHDFHLASASEIRASEDYHRVRVDGKYVDLCPSCYAKFKEAGV